MYLYSRVAKVATSPMVILFLAGVFFALSQLAPMLWWGIPLGFILFVLGIWKSLSWRKAAMGGLMVGTLKSMGGFAWIWHAYPLVWLDINSAVLQFLLIGLYWLSTSIFMGLGIVLPALVLYYLRLRVWAVVAAFPISWLMGEVLGSLFVSLWLLGPGSYLNIYIGHGYAGLPLAQFDWLLPFMSLWGLYGLTYMAALSGVLFAVVVVLKTQAALAGVMTLSFLVVAVNTFLPMQAVETTGLKVIAVDTAFTATSQKTDSGRALKQQEVTEAIMAAATHQPGVILLPEDSRFSRQYAGPDEARKQLQILIPEFEGLVVDTARIDTDEGAVLRAFYHDMSTDQTYMTDKQFLVPQGEYVTYPFHFLLSLFGQGKVIARTDKNQNYIPGPIADYQDFPPDMPPLIFCSEGSSAWGIVRIKDGQDVPLFLHPTSHSWFSNPYILDYQLSTILKIKAVWNDVTIVTAPNMSDSRRYLPTGKVDSGKVLVEERYWSLVGYEI